MLAGVWVNISPGQLAARSQSCNLRLSTACIRRANKEVPSSCKRERERERDDVCIKQSQRKSQRENMWRWRDVEKKSDIFEEASLLLSRPDGLRCSVV